MALHKDDAITDTEKLTVSDFYFSSTTGT